MLGNYKKTQVLTREEYSSKNTKRVNNQQETRGENITGSSETKREISKDKEIVQIKLNKLFYKEVKDGVIIIGEGGSIVQDGNKREPRK